ncbi:MAG: hypothetical protein HDT35_01835 [Clostridiales bacterium]|nr:hypothetical protein [Clostridiales bacterium]
MTILDTLITDRVPEDTRLARDICAKGWDKMTQAERASFLGGLKGAYGPTDMNRVREAIEYIDRLMVDAKRDSVVKPVPIDHAEYNGEAWKHWRDVVTVPSDYVGPDIYLPNINRLWAAARRFRAAVLARYDPDGNGYIPPEREISPGDFCTVLDSVGLLELRVTAVCPPGVRAEGVAWIVSESDTGWTARLDYAGGPYPDIGNALSALKISCGADAVTDATFTLSATLRYDYGVTAGTCAVRWSPFMTWGEARNLYQTWGGAKPLTWGEAARGGPV